MEESLKKSNPRGNLGVQKWVHNPEGVVSVVGLVVRGAFSFLHSVFLNQIVFLVDLEKGVSVNL